MSQNRVIGRVLSVDNFRVFIKIDEEINGAFRSGINDIYEVARINSYLIIPVGADRIVALITRVTMKEEVELNNSSTTSVVLPSSSRYISATMLGTIAQDGDKEQFIQGVYSFPSLDNPVWYVTEEDLNHIFDTKGTSDVIDYQKDFYLPIGTSPAFPDYKVKICPDQLFVKHAAILGNTGSGKSCTLTSILRNLFRFEYKACSKLQNAHIVIFDTNGEYKDAFLPEKKEEEAVLVNEELNLINAYYYGGDNNVKVPYWLMNWSELKSLLKPSDGAQAPVLNRAIGLAKNETEIIEKKGFPVIYIQYINDIVLQLNASAEEFWKIKNYSTAINGLKTKDFQLKTGERLNDILSKIPLTTSYEKPDPTTIECITEELNTFVRRMEEENINVQMTNEQNIDLPIWYSYQELCTKFLDVAINQEENNNNKVSEYLSTLRLRMNSFLNDKRIAIPLMLKDVNEANKNILPQFLSMLLGDYNKFFGSGQYEDFISGYNNAQRKEYNELKRTNQISIIDVSQLPFEVLETVTGILGRIILEFVSNFMPTQRGKYPIVIVLEEAQNYIAEEKDSIAKTVFERIAREGRKYGLSLIVSSQRPSELSKTVLSQCNSFVIHRLQNPDDQKYVRGLVSSANADLLEQLPIIPQQHAIITGDCVRTPVQVRIDDVDPTPNSHNPQFIENWIKVNDKIPESLYNDVCEKWIGGEKNLQSDSSEQNIVIENDLPFIDNNKDFTEPSPKDHIIQEEGPKKGD